MKNKISRRRRRNRKEPTSPIYEPTPPCNNNKEELFCLEPGCPNDNCQIKLQGKE